MCRNKLELFLLGKDINYLLLVDPCFRWTKRVISFLFGYILISLTFKSTLKSIWVVLSSFKSYVDSRVSWIPLSYKTVSLISGNIMESLIYYCTTCLPVSLCFIRAAKVLSIPIITSDSASIRSIPSSIFYCFLRKQAAVSELATEVMIWYLRDTDRRLQSLSSAWTVFYWGKALSFMNVNLLKGLWVWEWLNSLR